MSLSERLKWILEVDAKGAVKGVQDFGDAADKELGKAESKLDKVGGQMTKFGAGAMAFAGVAGAGLAKLAGSASEAAIEAGKFSDATGLSVEQASRWIEVAGDMGIEAGTVEKSLGFMNKTLGASPEKFRELGVEVVKAKDGTVDANATFLAVVDRLNAIKDPAERAEAGAKLLGRGWQEMAELIRTGSDSLKTSLDQVSDAKVTTPEELQRAKDFRAAIDQMKDAFQDLAINIGQGVMPVISTLAKGVSGVVDLFGKLDAVTGGTAGSLLGIGTAALGAAGALSFVAGKVITARSNFQKLFTTVDGDGVRSLNKLGTAASAATPAVIGLGVAVAAWEGLGQVAADSLNNVADAASHLSTVADEELLEQYKRVIVASAGVARNHDSVAESVYKMAAGNREGALRLLEYLKATGAAPALINPLQTSLQKLNIEAERGAKTAADHADAIDDGAVAVNAAIPGQQEYAKAILEGQQRAEDETKALADKALATEESQRAAQHARDEENRLADAALRVEQATRDQIAAWDELTGKLDSERALLNLHGQFDTLTEKIMTSVAAAKDGSITQEQAMRDVALEINTTKQAVIDYATKIGEVPVEKVTEYLSMIDEGQYEEVQRRLDVLSRNRTMELSIEAKGGTGNFKIVGIPAFDDGGTVPGPKGAPQLIIAHGGERVTPDHKTPTPPAGVTNVTINARRLDRGTTDDIREFSRRNGRMKGQRHRHAKVR